jgi:phosphodiesterase/alkaline phosphatase D-like protein
MKRSFLGRVLILGCFHLSFLTCSLYGQQSDNLGLEPYRVNAYGGKTVLFVPGDTPMHEYDEAIAQYLRNMGFNVVVIEDDYVTAGDAYGKDLIVISERISSVLLGKTFTDVPVPIVCLEWRSYIELGMTDYGSGTNYGEDPTTDSVDILDPSHPLAAGLSGTVKVYNSIGYIIWGKPSANASVVACVHGKPEEIAIFGYETGAEMIFGTAPARRVGPFLYWAKINDMTSGGRALFDASIRWAMDNYTPPPVDTTPPIISNVSNSNLTSSSARITWNTNEASDSQVEYGLTQNYDNVSSLESDLVTSHQVDIYGLEANTTYHYQVRSRDAAGNLTASEDFTFKTSEPPDVTGPFISNVNATNITYNSAVLRWNTDEASDSQVEYGLSQSYGNNSDLISDLVMAHSVKLSGLSASTTYHYRVRSRDAAGNLTASEDFTFKTSEPPDLTGPVISNVNATNITYNSAVLNWNTDEASDSQVEYGLSQSYGNSSDLISDLVTSHSVKLSGLSASTTYHYCVKSRDAARNLTVSGDFTFMTSEPPDTTGPTISNIHVENITYESAVLVWNTDEKSDSQVEYGLSQSYGSLSNLVSNLVTSHSIILSGLMADTTYHYRVKSRDGSGNITVSADYSFDTPQAPDVTKPVISDIKVIGVTDSSAVITWQTNELSDSQVEYGLDVSYGSESLLSATLLLSHSVKLEHLNENTVYHYRVKSRDAAGNISVSDDESFQTTKRIDTTAPVIENVQEVDISDSAAVITWETDELSTGQVEYGFDLNYGMESKMDSSLVTAHAIGLNNLESDKIYHFRIASIDGAGNESISGDYSFKTLKAPDVRGPVISNIRSIDVSEKAATIVWDTDEGSDSRVEYGLSQSYGNASYLISDLVTSHSVKLSGLSASTTYHYRVKSRDAAGNLTVSGDFTFKTSAPPDVTGPVITDVKAIEVTDSSAVITWVTDENSDGQIVYGFDSHYGYVSLVDTNMTQLHRIVLGGLTDNKTYHYQVISKDSSQNTTVSSDYSFKTNEKTITGVSSASDAKMNYELPQNFPNPFNMTTRICYQLPENSYVKLEIYNIMQQQVKILAEGFEVAGNHALEWDGRDKDGIPLPSGIYYCHMNSKGFSQTRQMLLLK